MRLLNPDVRPLAVSSLIVDLDVQRAIDPARVNKIAADLNPAALGTITVSHRSNGTYHIIDGQHRVSAVRLVEGEDEKLLCRVFDGLTVAEEAEMFRLLNNTAKPPALDLFRVRVVEGDLSALAIVSILNKYGWAIGAGGAGCIAAVGAVERLYARDADALERSVAMIARAWGHELPANDGRLVEGIGHVFARYGAAIDVADLVPRMASFPGGPGALLGKAKGLREMIGGRQDQAVAEIVVETWNRGRKTRALPPWRSSK